MKSSKKKRNDEDKDLRIKVSSKGKRLFSFLLDFVMALLFVNTITQVFRREHWDLAIKFRDFQDLIPFYGSVLLIFFLKDIFGCSLGKFLLGMRICVINNLSKSPSIFKLISRNIFLIIFPIEGIILLQDSYARRFADKLHGTLVIDKKNPMRPILRIFLGNIILFGFFAIAVIFQRSSIEKSAAYQKALESISDHAELQILLEKNPVIEEPEMHLDLRGEKSKNSIVQFRVGSEELGKLVKVFLTLQNNPKSWMVEDIIVEPIVKSWD